MADKWCKFKQIEYGKLNFFRKRVEIWLIEIIETCQKRLRIRFKVKTKIRAKRNLSFLLSFFAKGKNESDVHLDRQPAWNTQRAKPTL